MVVRVLAITSSKLVYISGTEAFQWPVPNLLA
jgi:hypothetical protein